MLLTRGLAGERDALLTLASTMDASQFVEHMLLSRVPWVFRSDPEHYFDWRRGLSQRLDVDPHGLLIVGSACVGASLNPSKQLFAPFTQRSDIDLAVVSARHFDLAWRTIRRIHADGPELPSEDDRRLTERHRKSLVFDGAIATERYLARFDFGADWLSALRMAQKDPFLEGHRLRVRVYRDVESLRMYHEGNVRRMARQRVPAALAEEGEKLNQVGTEDANDEVAAAMAALRSIQISRNSNG